MLTALHAAMGAGTSHENICQASAKAVLTGYYVHSLESSVDLADRAGSTAIPPPTKGFPDRTYKTFLFAPAEKPILIFMRIFMI